MNRPQSRQPDPNTLAVLHRTGSVWRALAARMPGGAGTNKGKPQILAHRTFTDPEVAHIDAWLDEYEVSSVINVLHAPSVICRTCPLPDAPADHLLPALRLQAEAHLFGIAPPHRMGMAVLEAAPGETSRSGIILAWPERSHQAEGTSSNGVMPPTTRETFFAPDVGSLACLLDGLRPDQPLAWVDRVDGSLALAVAHSNGAVFRGMREDAGDGEAWQQSVVRVLAETMLSVGHSPSFVESLSPSTQRAIEAIGENAARLIAPPEVFAAAKQRLDNAPNDEDWWAEFGIAAGIVIARGGTLAPLTALRATVAAQKPTPIAGVIEALSSRKVAAIAVAACIAVLMFGPFIAGGLRLAILSVKHPEQSRHAELARINSIRNQLVMYRELDRTSWSTTKVLADIVSNTPEGIELEYIRINQNKSFTVRGRAIPHGNRSATEVVGLMRQYLNDSGIFHDASLHWREPDAHGNYQFDLTANLIRPYRRFDYPDELDFGRWTLADRLQGIRPGMVEEDEPDDAALADAHDLDDDIASLQRTISTLVGDDFMDDAMDDEEPFDALAYDDEDDDVRSPRSRPGLGLDSLGSRTSRDGAAGIDSRTEGPASSPMHDIPPPMTREQIHLMSEAEVRDILNRVAQARSLARNRRDTELENRLRQEMDWLMERIRNF